MSGKGSRTGSTAYREARERLLRRSRAAKAPCAICGRAIDYRLRYPDPLSFSADHTTAHSAGGSDRLANLRPSHLDCNKRRGARPSERSPKTTPHGFYDPEDRWNPTSRGW